MAQEPQKYLGTALDDAMLAKIEEGRRWLKEHEHSLNSFDDQNMEPMVKVLVTDDDGKNSVVKWIPLRQIVAAENVLSPAAADEARRLAAEAEAREGDTGPKW